MELLNLAALLGLAAPDTSAISMQLVLELSGNAERKAVTYECEGVEQPFVVDYINANPNFIAILPIDHQQLVMAAVVSADGSRYLGGPFEWWTHGTDTTFTDLRYKDVAPVNCSERIDTP